MLHFAGIVLRAAMALFAVIVVGLIAGLVVGGVIVALWQATILPAMAVLDAWAQIGIIAAPWVFGVIQVFCYVLYWFAILVSIGVVASRSADC